MGSANRKTGERAPRIADNRKARFDYHLDDKYEAGLSLLGWEVKSARAGTVNLKDSFIFFDNGQPILKNCHFSTYAFGDLRAQDPLRDRPLLLNKSEIKKIHDAVKMGGVTCVPTKIYFNSRGLVKLEIAIARGKKNYDKKQAMKERDLDREARREI